MGILQVLLCVSLVTSAINVFALVASRRGTSRAHTLAFISGTVGLASAPVFVIGVGGLAAQFMYPSFQSAYGITFLVAAMTLGAATLISLIQALRLKPTPDN